MSASTTNGTIFFAFGSPAQCRVCTNPANVVMQRDKLAELLDDVRKLTHPDVCNSPKATEVTARVNACLDEVRRWRK